MSKWSIAPYYFINKFIEASLRDEDIIPAESSYVTELDSQDVSLPFFIPAQQTAEMTSAYNEAIIEPGEEGFVDLPFGIYTVAILSRSDSPFFSCGRIAYTFYSHDVDKLFEIVNYVVNLCQREDWTAADINDFLKSDANNPFEFKTIISENSAGPMETEDEGGRYAYMVVVYYESTYEGLSRDSDGPTVFSGNLGMWY